MARYYFLTTMLPEVFLEEQPKVPFEELIPLYLQNLTAADFEQFQQLRRWIDVQNMLLFWQGLELDPRGNWLKKTMETQLLTQDQLTEAVVDYLASYETDAERAAHYPELQSSYLREQVAARDGFIQEYLAFEHGWRLVAAAIRAKRLGRDLNKELASEDPEDPLVAWLLSFKDSPIVEAPYGYEWVAEALEKYRDEPMELRRAIMAARMHWLVERIQDEPFTLDWLLGYAVQVLLAEQWCELDAGAGEKIVDAMVAS
jgi:hypothetical protein